MDKGYHDNGLLVALAKRGVRTYIPTTTKSPALDGEAGGTGSGISGQPSAGARDKGRQLNRWRSERCERTFAHVCETGGGRRAWLHGQTNVSKTHTLNARRITWACCSAKFGAIASRAMRKRGRRPVSLCFWSCWRSGRP